MVDDDEAETSQIDSHLAFGGIVASVHLTDADWQHLKTETDANGPLAASIDRYFMDRVDLSKLKTGVSSKT